MDRETDDERNLFDGSLLSDDDSERPGPSMRVYGDKGDRRYHLRPLRSSDYECGKCDAATGVRLYRRILIRFFPLVVPVRAGYIELLSQLTVTGNVTPQMYAGECVRSDGARGGEPGVVASFFYPSVHCNYVSDTFHTMRTNKVTYIIVLEDTLENRLVASGTLSLEKKFIHSCGQVRRDFCHTVYCVIIGHVD